MGWRCGKAAVTAFPPARVAWRHVCCDICCGSRNARNVWANAADLSCSLARLAGRCLPRCAALQSIVNYEQGLASRLLAESPSFAREYAAVALELLRSPGGVSINSIPGEERRKWMAQVKANSICYLVGRRLADDDDGTGEAVVRGVNAAGAGGGGVHGEVCRAAAYLERDEGGTAGDSHGSRSCWRRRGPALNDDDDVVGFPLQHSSPLRC